MASLFTRVVHAVKHYSRPVHYDELLTALARAVGSVFKAERILQKWQDMGIIAFDDEGEVRI